MRRDDRTMSATEARQFDRFSVANAVTVESVLACGCQAYRDVFTYNRWKAQGFQVQKGQRAIKLPLLRVIEAENKETGEVQTRRVLGQSAVFCRCQVKPINGGATQ